MISYKEMLQKIMERKGYNQEQMAYLLRVNKAQVTRWLAGAVPKIENLRKIKKLYDEVMANESNKRIN